VHGVEEPVYGHKEQVEEVDGGALDHPVDPGGEVVPPDDARVKGARDARAYIRMETLFECAKFMQTDDFHIPIKEKNAVDHWVN
jgi:hypothetical protein